MSDDKSRATRKRTARTAQPDSTKGNFDNVEFLDASLADPLNVLRLKLKQLSSLPQGVRVRRVIVMVDVISEAEGRGLDINWNEEDDEPFYVVQDSILSMLARVTAALASSNDEE